MVELTLCKKNTEKRKLKSRIEPLLTSRSKISDGTAQVMTIVHRLLSLQAEIDCYQDLQM